MPAERPNLLIIMADDLGPWAMGCAGTPELRTPSLDALAAEGMRFSNFFCASPVCSPARASWLTGRMPSAHGVHDWLRGGNVDDPDGRISGSGDRPIEYLAGLTGFTDVLAAHGWRCGLAGKWHMGDSARPQKGHSYWRAYALGGGNYRDWHAFSPAGALVRHREYVTDWITACGLHFLEQHARDREPWCLSVHYTAPHSPWDRAQHPAALFDSYADSDFPSIPREAPHPWDGWNPTPEERQLTLQGYAAAVEAMDARIGRLLARLEARGARERTLVVFLSDNGFNLGHHGIRGKGNGTWPLNMYEESVKVPFLVWRPDHVPAGRVEEGLWSAYDWFPTLLDYLGLPGPNDALLPGRSFAAVLRGEEAASHDLEGVVVCEEYGPARMIRDGRWKYVHRYPDGPHELYDLVADPGERLNRIGDPGCAAVVAERRGRLEAWFSRYGEARHDGRGEAVSGQGQMDWHAHWPRREGQVGC
jgi:arylsulfatase A-like enzyme